MNSSSTLVATVSINYEDFTEGFLTCGTCLYAYDQAEHTPKLLSCSHTICQSCLELIASSPSLNNSTEAGCIKCPICRQNITIPNGGIGALPPSFLVNQLFDLVNKKPREFIPKCSIHIEQELLFCETCDCVFCDTCNNNSNESDDSLTGTTTSSLTTSSLSSTPNNPSTVNQNSNLNTNSRLQSTQQQQQNSNNKQHISEVCTVIPFSTAIKRMSEILNYKSQQCSGKLDEARDNVQREIEKLEANCSDALRDISAAFDEFKVIIEEGEKKLLEETKKLHEYKKNVLLEQLTTIETEKSSLAVNNGIKVNNETDVKNLSKKVSDLTAKNDTASSLFTPRENCFICFENENKEALVNIRESINEYGKIRTSKTYPPFCTSKLLTYSTHLRSTALVQSVDYNGSPQKIGGDPIQAELRLVGCNEDIDGEININDKRDGTYEVSFVPPVPGKYQLFIYIFNRPIKDCPLTFETNSHHNPVAIFGRSSKKGQADQFDHFNQPAGLTINKHNGRIYILDSFNSRIKILAQIDSVECPFSFMQHIQTDYFNRSCTGIALLHPEDDDECDEQQGIQTLSLSPTKPPNPNILVTDWRNRIIYELNSDGKLIRQYTHDDLLEPTNIVVDSRGRIFVVDRESIFVFNSSGKLLHRLTGYKFSSKHTTTTTTTTGSDNSSIKKIDPFIDDHQLATSPEKLQQPSLYNTSTTIDNITNTTLNNKENKVINNNNNAASYTNNTSANDKRSSIKTNTLSSLISLKRKPKLIPANSSLQRGSKAVMSAASRIRSTFTLSHSTSLVSAASLQSMFHNSNKNNAMNINNTNNNNNQQQHHFDSQSICLLDNSHNNSSSVASNERHKQKPATATANRNAPALNTDGRLDCSLTTNNNNYQLSKQNSLPINEFIHHSNQQQQNPNSNHQQCEQVNTNHRQTSDNISEEDTIEPFGIIRGIAIGPDDELIIADESRIRVLEYSDDEYVFKRELLVENNQHHHHQLRSSSNPGANYNSQSGNIVATSNWRLCAMTYDGQSKKLLILRTNISNTGTPYIQVVDYECGKSKFIIDSHESKLIRPSCLATYGQHVIVTDLGNDCIKKYRFI